jgi:hypothetical protein
MLLFLTQENKEQSATSLQYQNRNGYIVLNYNQGQGALCCTLCAINANSQTNVNPRYILD